MTLTVRPPRWKLQEFERALALREVAVLTDRPAYWQDGIIVVDGHFRSHEVRRLKRRLSLASAIETPSGETHSTTQYLLEQAQGAGRRKTTSHALHGLHPYKGKFYPQLARALMNACGVPDKGKVLDPFAGCGTTVLEATMIGMRGIGVDANPLAVLVAQTKLRVLGREPDALRAALRPLTRLPRSRNELPDSAYLKRWLPAANLRYLERLLAAIESISDIDANRLARVCLSSVLRLASHQEPSQLRVLRRPPDAKVPELRRLFQDALNQALRSIEATQLIKEIEWSRIANSPSDIMTGDSRRLLSNLRRHTRGSFDAVITSPPYANALPYIDTDRLSLRAFGMLDDGGQRAAELRQIGNREVPDSHVRALNDEVADEIRDPQLPERLQGVLKKARCAARDPDAGFRRQRTPALLLSYFRDMQTVIQQTASLLRPGAPAVLVIGDSTIRAAGGGTVSVPTGEIISDLAIHSGLQPILTFDKRLTSFGASSTVHQRNAMSSEKIFVFRRAANAPTPEPRLPGLHPTKSPRRAGKVPPSHGPSGHPL